MILESKKKKKKNLNNGKLVTLPSVIEERKRISLLSSMLMFCGIFRKVGLSTKGCH